MSVYEELDKAIDCANEFAQVSIVLLELVIMREHLHMDTCVFRTIIPKEVWHKGEDNGRD